MAKLIGAVLTVVMVAGCGAGQRETDSAGTAAQFLAAVDHGDTTVACDLLAPDTLAALDSCDESVAGLDAGEVRDVTVWGDRAQVRSDAGALFLVELAVGWRVSAAGCRPAAEDTYECDLAGS
jgi:hypothetical protein